MNESGGEAVKLQSSLKKIQQASVGHTPHTLFGQSTCSGYLGDRVVDVDGWDLQLTLLQHLVQVVDTGGGLL